MNGSPTQPDVRSTPQAVPSGGWLAGIALLTWWELVYPLDMADHPVHRWLDYGAFHRVDALGNLLIFGPLAWLIAWRWRVRHFFLAQAVIGAVAICMGISLLGETVQVYLPQRQSSLSDWVLNGIGSAIFAWLGWRYASRGSNWLGFWCQRWRSSSSIRQWGWYTLTLLALRWFPWAIAPQSREIRLAFGRAWNEGWPLSRTWQVMAMATTPDSGAWMAMGLQWVRLLWVMGLWAIWSWLLGRALDQRYPNEKKRWAEVVFGLGVIGALLIEPFRLLIDGALFSMTDLAAALTAVAIVSAVRSIRA